MKVLGRNYRDLIAWQKAIDLVEAIYRASSNYPREELYGLTSQTRRSAVSVAANIAEGQGRRTPGEFLSFLSIAKGSVNEVETQLIIAQRLGFLTDNAASPILSLCTEVSALTTGLANSIERKK